MLPTAPSRSSWDLGSWARPLHLLQPRCQAKLLCCRSHKGEKRATKKTPKNLGKTRNSEFTEGKGSEVGLEQADVVGRATSAWGGGGGHCRPQDPGLDVPPAHLRATRKVFVSLLGISQEMEGSPYCWQEKEAIFLLNQAAPVSKVPQRNPTALRAGLFL